MIQDEVRDLQYHSAIERESVYVIAIDQYLRRDNMLNGAIMRSAEAAHSRTNKGIKAILQTIRMEIKECTFRLQLQLHLHRCYQ